jgi:mRNA interferase YafQ
MLENEDELPKELKAHRLAGQYKDCVECHIESDFLLIWLDEHNDIIEILRFGSHSKLFR